MASKFIAILRYNLHITRGVIMKNISTGILLSTIAATYLLGVSTCPDNLVLNNQDDGDSSLRACVANAGMDSTITFNGDFNIILSSKIDIQYTDLTIDGTDNAIIIDGNNSSGIFEIYSTTLTLSKVTIQDANATSGSAVYADYYSTLNIIDSNLSNNLAELGGAIYSSYSSVNVSNSTISNNSASNASSDGIGGAIYADGSDVNISNSTISNNIADSLAGAISTYDTYLSISNSTITNNSAAKGGAIDVLNGQLDISDSNISSNTTEGEDNQVNNGYGGAIYSNSAEITISNTIISDNNASDSGGGIALYDSNVTISESTITHNIASDYGGAIQIYDDCNVTILNSTIARNQANSSGAIDIYNAVEVTIINSTISLNSALENASALYSNNSILKLEHSTVTNNSSVNDIPAIYGDLYGGVESSNSIISGNSDNDFNEVLSLGHNILGVGTVVNESETDIITTNPMLEPLADNGGPTLTCLPMTNSPAVDAGLSTLIVDQRGVERPQGDAVDIGAVELESGYTASPAIIMYLLN